MDNEKNIYWSRFYDGTINPTFKKVDIEVYKHALSVYGGEFVDITSPAPLSEQKQEGETVEQAEEIAADKRGLTHPRTSYQLGFDDGAQWQSQHTAKQIEESRAVNADLRNGIHNLEVDNDNLQQQIDQYKARIVELEAKIKWHSVSEVMPPFDKLILLKGEIVWRSGNYVSYFPDIVVNDYEQLEYGYAGYLLKEHSDYLVVKHPNPEEVASEYITDWRYID